MAPALRRLRSLGNHAQGSGSGFVSYTIRPRDDVETGTEISAQARVLFNNAPPQDTVVLRQVMDAVAPTTVLTATPLVAGGSDFDVSWSASDDPAGSGVKHVTVYVAEDAGDFKIWLRQTTETSGIYQGRTGHTYQFLALATDNAGNREQPPFNVLAPDDGSALNLGAPPSVGETTPPNFGEPPAPSPEPSSNPLFVEAQQGIPATPPASRPSEFQTVLRPFAARAFAPGIAESHAGIGPMAIAVLPDGSLLASGGPSRGQLFRLAPDGGQAGTPVASVPYPIFDMSLAADGTLWATTGGGPLLELDSTTGAILAEFGDGLTQSLAIHPATGDI